MSKEVEKKELKEEVKEEPKEEKIDTGKLNKKVMTYEKYAAIIKWYKSYNPVKYAMKKEALKKKLLALK